MALLVAQLAVLIVAGIIAWRQVSEAKRLREAQVRPFVVIDFEVEDKLVYYVIRNIGATIARDVRLAFDPAPTSALLGARDSLTQLTELKLFSDGIPSFPPGKVVRGIFDNFPEREEAAIHADVYEVTSSYQSDELKRSYVDVITLDLGVHRNILHVVRKDSLHDVTKALDEIVKALKSHGH